MFYAILSDIHANFQALKAVESQVNRLYTLLESDIHYWFLGDIVGYGPEPVECLRWLWSNFKEETEGVHTRWVVGNHDQEVVNAAQARARVSDNGQRAGNSATGTSDEARVSWEMHSRLLPEDQRRWSWFAEKVAQAESMDAHDLVHVPFESLHAILVHGSIERITRRTNYLHSWLPDLIKMDLRAARELSGDAPTTLLFHGHSHYPHLASLGAGDKVDLHSIHYGKPYRLNDGVYAINPGSVGQPRDGDPRAAFALLDSDARTITFYRVMYNVLDSMRKLEEGGYPASLIERLESADGREYSHLYRTIYAAPRLDRLMTRVDDTESNGAR